MPMIESIDELRRRRDELHGDLAAIGDFRPGTLVEYRRKCGKPNGHCAQTGDPGHPGWALMRKAGGKHVNRGIPKGALEETRAQIAEHRRFRDLTRRLVEAGEGPYLRLTSSVLETNQQTFLTGRHSPTSLPFFLLRLTEGLARVKFIRIGCEFLLGFHISRTKTAIMRFRCGDHVFYIGFLGIFEAGSCIGSVDSAVHRVHYLLLDGWRISIITPVLEGTTMLWYHRYSLVLFALREC